MKQLVKKVVFGVLGVVLLCLPATAWAVPLDDALNTPTSLLGASTEPDTTPTPKPVLEAPRLSRSIARIDKELLVSIGHDTVVLQPNTDYEIYLNDVSLGTHTSDPNGQLFVQVKLPPHTTPGTHTLTVTTPTQDITKPIQLI